MGGEHENKRVASPECVPFHPRFSSPRKANRKSQCLIIVEKRAGMGRKDNVNIRTELPQRLAFRHVRAN